MINTNIKVNMIELTSAIQDYVDKKVESLEKFSGNEKITHVYVDIGKTTNHHQKGDVYRAEFNISLDGHNIYVVSEKEDLYQAIDDAREQAYLEIVSNKEKAKTLFRKGAKKIKDMIKGMYPF
jgi:ribosomal subunit interface protein